MGPRLAFVSTLLVALPTFRSGSAHAADPPAPQQALGIDPPAISSAPGALVMFHATGGSAGYVWSMEANPSGGWIEANGSYHAGPFPLVQDRVRVTDAAGNVATATVDVTYWDPLVVTPPRASLSPRASRQINAAGGIAPYTFSFVSNASVGSVSSSGLYQAGRKGKVVDVVRVTDSVGQTATVTFSVTASLSVVPATGKVPPRGSVAFVASGGSGTTYTWSIVQNLSGGAIDATTGIYHAGVGTHCADVVRAQDALGNIADVSVSIGGGVAIAPPSPSTFPFGTIAFEGFGGTGSFTWALPSSPSGATIDPNTGIYRAGPVGGVQDEVIAVDALGNRRATVVDVGAAVALSPASSSVETGATIAMSVAGGSGSYVSFTFEKNESGASITPELLYTAGPKPGRDTVVIVDSVGSAARATVDVREQRPTTTTQAPAPPSTPALNLGGGGAGAGCAAAPATGMTSAAGAVVAIGLAAARRRRRR